MSVFTNEVIVDSIVGTVLVDGSAHTQPVSGSVSVSNLPVTQPVSGAVTVSQPAGTNLHVVVDSGTISTSGAAASVATITRVATSASSTILLAANASRKKAIISTETGSSNYVALGSAASVTSYTYNLGANTVLEVTGWTGSITLTRGSGTGNVQVTELV